LIQCDVFSPPAEASAFDDQPASGSTCFQFISAPDGAAWADICRNDPTHSIAPR
jgi:hypothetical protein